MFKNKKYLVVNFISITFINITGFKSFTTFRSRKKKMTSESIRKSLLGPDMYVLGFYPSSQILDSY